MIGGAGASPPGAPTGVSAGSATASTMSVSFSAPANNGGSAITGFTVTSSPGGVTASGASSPITVTGLTASTSYTFTVTATNAIGTSPASAASSAVSTSAAELYAFTSQTFTTASTTGRSGPSLGSLNAVYAGQPFLTSGNFSLYSSRAGYQRLVIPATATYRITAQGASGARANNGYTPGRGAIIVVDVPLTIGEAIVMLVGQPPGNQGYDSENAGGGGGSFVLKEAIFSSAVDSNIIVIAGGGCGSAYNYAGGAPSKLDASLTATVVDADDATGSAVQNGFGANGLGRSGSTGAAGPGSGIYGIGTNFSYTGSAIAAQAILTSDGTAAAGYYAAINGGGGTKSGFPAAGAAGNHAGGTGSGYSGGAGASGNSYRSSGGSSWIAPSGGTFVSSSFGSSSNEGVAGSITITKL